MSFVYIPPESCPKLTQLELVVSLCETDPYGIVNNAEYFNYFEIARLDYLKNCGINIQKSIESFPLLLRSWSCKYINPLKAFDTMLIKTMMRNDPVQLRYTFSQFMYNKHSNRLLAKSVTVVEEVAGD